MQEANPGEKATNPTQSPRMRATGLKIGLGQSITRTLDQYVKDGYLTLEEASRFEMKDEQIFVPEGLSAAARLQAGIAGERVRQGIEAIGFRDRSILTGLNTLMQVCGEGAKASGWHKDRPERMPAESADAFEARLRNWQGMKIMLMVSELAEGVEELRKGHPADLTYYPEADLIYPRPVAEGSGKFKPEGLPSELADTVIRILDFCFTEGISLGEMILEKLVFNQTRGQKHGGKTV